MTNKEKLDLAKSLLSDMEVIQRKEQKTYTALNSAIEDMKKFIQYYKETSFCPHCGGDV